MKLKDIMTTDVLVIAPDTTAREAARQMDQHDIGAVPVCDGQRILGMITDRDIAIQVVARGENPDDVRAADIMTTPVVWCFEDCDIDEAARLMETRQIRRLVVVDREKKLVGVVALGDLATRVNEQLAGEALEKISEPTHPMH
ncbi:MAG: CBS domain-containing protein [Bdellovibrionales bacterium]